MAKAMWQMHYGDFLAIMGAEAGKKALKNKEIVQVYKRDGRSTFHTPWELITEKNGQVLLKVSPAIKGRNPL